MMSSHTYYMAGLTYYMVCFNVYLAIASQLPHKKFATQV